MKCRITVGKFTRLGFDLWQILIVAQADVELSFVGIVKSYTLEALLI